MCRQPNVLRRGVSSEIPSIAVIFERSGSWPYGLQVPPESVDRCNHPDAVPARSAVFGFPLVYFKPEQARGAVEAVVFDEWKLPRRN